MRKHGNVNCTLKDILGVEKTQPPSWIKASPLVLRCPGNIHLFSKMAIDFRQSFPKMARHFEEREIFAKLLANEVKNNCASQNINVPLNLCLYLVDLKLIQSSKRVWELTPRGSVAESVVAKCTQELIDDDYLLKTLKLQMYWMEKYRSRDTIKKIHHKTIFKNVFPIMTEIVEGSLVKGVDKEEFCKKIVIFIIMFAGLGSPTQQKIIKETQAALHSIFKITEVDNFINLAKPAKEQQLIELARLVTGIKLFNKDCKKGGEGIEDLPLILTQGVKATRERLFIFNDQLDARIRSLVGTFLQKYNPSEEGTPVTEKESDGMKTVLTYLRQTEKCLRALLRNLEESSVVVEALVQRLQATLLQVHEVVRYRVAVATIQVFPLFLQLSDIWVEMQEEVDILSEINNNFVDLSVLANLTPLTSNESGLSSGEVAESEGGDIDESVSFFPGVEVCSFSSVPDQECLQYEGFCAWTIACTRGFLIPGNISIGILNFSNRFYVFSSADAAYKWAKNPIFYTKTVLSVVRDRPELIKLLNLYSDLEAESEEESAEKEEEKPARENAQVQTELHPVESYVSREHTFSEWELKRRALKLATLIRCATKSQQTITRSLFRTDVGVQATASKTVSTQTNREKCSGHPTFLRSVLGLRNGLCLTDPEMGVVANTQ